MRAALIQCLVSGDKERDVQNAAARIAEAAKNGAQLVMLPEMFCCPYTNRCFAAYAEPVGGSIYTAMQQAAADNGVVLVAGSFPERRGDKIYNTAFAFDETGAQLARHRKMHLFDIDVAGGQSFKESKTFTAGDEVTVFDCSLGRFGICVCFDMRFPELSRCMTLRGAQAILVPAAFNMTTGPAHWELMFRQRAVDNQLFTLGCSPARDEKGEYVAYGNSIVCSPWGTVVARAGAKETILYADLDLGDNESIRAQLPLLSARRTDVYELKEIKG
ncbi:MAG: carbon-nitrogen hydrolase family protein [Clostridia bacterium]|nr:carbon-nitrogen hydrolase family protein [Clostridia bacterium]